MISMYLSMSDAGIHASKSQIINYQFDVLKTQSKATITNIKITTILIGIGFGAFGLSVFSRTN